LKRAALLVLLPLAAIVAVLLQPVPAAADLRSYALAVEQAHSLVKEGLNGRPDAAQRALAVLLPEVGAGQPEIVADLNKEPPDYADADKRLTALAATLGRPGAVADPAAAQAELHRILAQSRYSKLHANDSLWNRFWNWFDVQLFRFLSNLHLGGLPNWVWFALLGAAALMAAIVALLIVRTGWTRAGRALATGGDSPAAAEVDRFAEADAAAARGDYSAALRFLVAAVATSVSRKSYWESSPLTVRELFRGSGKLDQLRPLLVAFELAVYGFRPVDEATYRRAAELAQPFRVPSETAESAA
jgi:hypothetical protein